MRRRVVGSFDTNYYHVVSRVVDRRCVFGAEEIRYFRGLLRRLLRFTGIRCVTYCVMGNHFHLLLEVPDGEGREFRRGASDEDVVERVRWRYGAGRAGRLRQEFERLRAGGEAGGAEADVVRARYLARMYDLSILLKELKQVFSRWFNRRSGRAGTLWEDRFRSVLLEGDRAALLPVAAYIDLNPVRAGMVVDPKDYPFSGYGEAVARGRDAAVGLEALIAKGGVSVPGEEALATYRLLLYGVGEHGGSETKCRLDPCEIEAVIRARGRLSMAQVMRCRVRYFTRGVAFGRSRFLESVFGEYRHLFGNRRTTGMKKLRHAAWGDLGALRAPGSPLEVHVTAAVD